MTALCGGGASGPKAGVVETVIFTTASLASLLNNRGGAWALVAAPLLGVLAYDTEQLCLTDPPADPVFTADDYNAILTLHPTGLPAALAKLADMVKIAIWYTVCECKTMATPNEPAGYWLPPEGVSAPFPATQTPCHTFQTTRSPSQWTNDAGQTYVSGSTAGFDNVPTSSHTPGILPGTPITATPVGEISPWVLYPIQTAWEQIKTRAEASPGVGQIAWHVWGYKQSDNTKTPISLDLGPVPQNPDVLVKTGTVNKSAWAAYTHLAMPTNVMTAEQVVPYSMSVNVFCGAVEGTAPGSPCVTDPALLAMVQQLLTMVMSMREEVTLIQRQGVPFGYVPGPTHTPLSGTGELTVSGLIAATVVFETLPVHYGVAEGAPDRIFDAGYIALGTADGYQPAMRVTSSPFYVRVSGEITKIGYSFGPGVVASIAEHVREP